MLRQDKRISDKEQYLDEVLHCVENIQECQDYLRTGEDRNPLYTMVGILDWTLELQRLIKTGKQETKYDQSERMGTSTKERATSRGYSVETEGPVDQCGRREVSSASVVRIDTPGRLSKADGGSQTSDTRWK